MQNLNFSTVGIAIYSLGGNDWYAVEQDDKKVHEGLETSGRRC